MLTVLTTLLALVGLAIFIVALVLFEVWFIRWALRGER